MKTAGRSRSRRRRAAPRSDLAVPAADRDQRLGIVGMAQRDQRADEARAAVAVPCMRCEQQRVVGRVLRVGAAPRGRRRRRRQRARSAPSARRARRRARRRTGPSRRRSPAARSRAAAWRALASAFSTKVRVRLVGLGDAERALRHQLDAAAARAAPAARRASGVVGGEDQSHRRRAHARSRRQRAPAAPRPARRCPCRPAPAARPSRRARRSRLRPCPALRRSRRAPVITTFMSVSQAESST